MSNTAPSRADPVVVFPYGRWCPPQETSQPHPPHWTNGAWLVYWVRVTRICVNKLTMHLDQWCMVSLLTHIRVTRTQCVLLAKHLIWFHVFWCVIQRSENMCKPWPLIAPTFSQLCNVTFICIPWFCICKWRKFREMTTYPCQFFVLSPETRHKEPRSLHL